MTKTRTNTRDQNAPCPKVKILTPRLTAEAYAESVGMSEAELKDVRREVETAREEMKGKKGSKL